MATTSTAVGDYGDSALNSFQRPPRRWTIKCTVTVIPAFSQFGAFLAPPSCGAVCRLPYSRSEFIRQPRFIESEETIPEGNDPWLVMLREGGASSNHRCRGLLDRPPSRTMTIMGIDLPP